MDEGKQVTCYGFGEKEDDAVFKQDKNVCVWLRCDRNLRPCSESTMYLHVQGYLHKILPP